MLLSCRILQDVSGVNSFEYTSQAEWTEGCPTTLYIQLINASLDKANQGFNPPGRRYMPASGATLSVTLESIDDNKQVTKTATNPYASDTSIWAVSILSTDTIRGSPQIRLTLTEGSVITSGLLKCAVKIWPDQNVD